MKKSLFALLAVMTLSFWSCGNKQKEVPSDEPPVYMELSQKDTAAVLDLVNQYLELVKQGNKEEALAMLHIYENDSLKDLPAHFAEKQKLSMGALRPVRYEIERMVFRHENDCEVRYSAILFEKQDGDTAPNRITCHLKPVRQNGQWYLTIADSEDQNTASSLIDKY